VGDKTKKGTTIVLATHKKQRDDIIINLLEHWVKELVGIRGKRRRGTERKKDLNMLNEPTATRPFPDKKSRKGETGWGRSRWGTQAKEKENRGAEYR